VEEAAKVNEHILKEMLEQGLRAVTDSSSSKDAWHSLLTEEDIAAAETEVVAAQAVLAGAQAALANTELRAPFAGIITIVDVSPGEVVSPMPDRAVMTLADLSHLRLETTDLSERDVAELAVGQPANIFVEALGLEIEGRVAHIASQATIIGGDVVYRVVVELNEQPSALRWGMSADVTITTE